MIVVHLNKHVLVKVMPTGQENKHASLNSRPSITVEGKHILWGSEGED